jgi:hypothetical protein
LASIIEWPRRSWATPCRRTDHYRHRPPAQRCRALKHLGTGRRPGRTVDDHAARLPLSDDEQELHEAVTLHVREEMNRADKLGAAERAVDRIDEACAQVRVSVRSG